MLSLLVKVANRLRFWNRLRIWAWRNVATSRGRRDAREDFLTSWAKQGSVATPARHFPDRTSTGLVLGLAAGYREADLEVFLISFRLFNPLDRLVLVLDRTPNSSMQAFLANYRVESVVYPSIRLIDENMMNVRFELYSVIVQSAMVEPEWVLLTDVRDVFFQNSIGDAYKSFRRSTGSDLFFASEDPRYSIASCRYNRFWFEFAFGINGLNQFGSSPISCAGTTLGSYPKILQYLDRQSYWFRAICEASSLGQVINTDQAIHNMIVHSAEIPGASVLSNGDLFLTAGYLVTQGLSFCEGVAYEGIHPTVVHQYDRVPTLDDYARRTFLDQK